MEVEAQLVKRTGAGAGELEGVAEKEVDGVLLGVTVGEAVGERVEDTDFVEVAEREGVLLGVAELDGVREPGQVTARAITVPEQVVEVHGSALTKVK